MKRIRFASVLIALGAVSGVQAQNVINSVSVNLAPTLFFKYRDEVPFEKLPFETADVEIMDFSTARSRGFVTENPDGTKGFETNSIAFIESWQRFCVVRGVGNLDFMNSVEDKTPLDFRTLETFDEITDLSKIRKTLLRVGVSFRVVMIIEASGNIPSTLAEIQAALRGANKVWAKIEIAGIGSPKMTESLPGVFTLFSGDRGIGEFLKSTEKSRQQVWDSFFNKTIFPKQQVLGWAFKPKTPPPTLLLRPTVRSSHRSEFLGGS